MVSSPLANATTSSTFSVAGVAPGPWFFEASFPIEVRDGDGIIVGTTHAQAQAPWTTTNLVPFTATITLSPNFHGPASLILLKDNESGLPENDDSVTVPITVQ